MVKSMMSKGRGFGQKMRLSAKIMGLAALIWFLIRVIPKPSRAAYPCQRTAFPLATAFVIWFAGLAGSCISFKKAKSYARQSRYKLTVGFAVLAIAFLAWFAIRSSNMSFADIVAPREIELQQNPTTGPLVSPRAVVSIVRSQKATAIEIDSLEIESMVRQAVAMAGGLDSLIRDGYTVVLKPNLIATAILDDNYYPTNELLPKKVNAVTTDYRVIQAVVHLIREKNPHGKIYIMEGSGIGATRDNMKKMGWLDITGVDEFICLDKACGAWRDKTAKELVKVSLPEGKALYTAARNEYYLNRIYHEADVVISLPVLKTHSNAAVTGAVKNVGIGATPINIYGASTTRQWRVDTINHGGANNTNLHDWIHDYYLCRPVNFAVMDALTGMENGPTPVKSDPVSLRRKNTRCILASSDPVALDAIESLIIQVDPMRVRHLMKLYNDGAGCADPRYIRVAGVRVDQIKDRYLNAGNYACYNDFNPPIAAVDSFKFDGNSLHLGLTVEAKVKKVEIAVEGTFIDPIVVSDFGNFTVNLGKGVSDPSCVKVYVYDSYLNCTILGLGTTGVRETKNPEDFILLQNYPNPFNPVTTITFTLSARANVSLKIYDLLGREVATLLDKELPAGNHSQVWNAINIPSGEYLCRLQANSVVDTCKLILVR